MPSDPSHHCQLRACEAIEGDAFDFTAKFYAAYELHALAQKETTEINPRTLEALQALLVRNKFSTQRQCLFLYREAANVLATVLQLGLHQPIARLAYGALRTVLRRSHGRAQQAAAEALGRLPVDVQGPRLPQIGPADLPVVDAEALRSVDKKGAAARPFESVGRCRVAPLPDNQRLFVIKLARCQDDIPALQREIQWMRCLAQYAVRSKPRFDVPRPMRVDNHTVFRLQSAHTEAGGMGCPFPENAVAIAFVASKDYFCYPNDLAPHRRLTPQQFVEVMGRNAFWLGYLTGQGIVHEAPIPLFHNRVQQERRRDSGRYEWYRGGRLDRWLSSCAYPNFGVSGLRDFEHFTSFNGNSILLYRHLGNHLLSLLLVAGSYFRAKAPLCLGWEENRRPVDVRHLFDATVLRQVILTIFDQYRFGFTGKEEKDKLPIDLHQLVRRMVQEMGIDHHMEEYLRVADQQQMSQVAFESFLRQRDFGDQCISQIKKGATDLTLQSGPHLGAFNRAISVPELTEAVAAMAAVCMAERFLHPHRATCQTDMARA